jgi:hypothetical protein
VIAAIANPTTTTTTTAAAARSPFPSRAQLALATSSPRDLERVMVRGEMPDVEQLIGWEFRGINQPEWTRIFGIKKFVKGFFRTGDGVAGYNCAVAANALDGRWRLQPDDNAARRFGFFAVAPVDATRRDNAYLHALLLDYGAGGNPWWDASRGVRDYLVSVDGNPDLYLGKAYYALGPARVHSNYFVLERHRPAPATH